MVRSPGALNELAYSVVVALLRTARSHATDHRLSDNRPLNIAQRNASVCAVRRSTRQDDNSRAKAQNVREDSSADLLRHLQLRETSYGWAVEMILRGALAGLRIAEVPVTYHPRIGRSKITGTFRGSIGAAWYIFGRILQYRWRTPGRYSNAGH
jgi:hypothetical protein